MSSTARKSAWMVSPLDQSVTSLRPSSVITVKVKHSGSVTAHCATSGSRDETLTSGVELMYHISCVHSILRANTHSCVRAFLGGCVLGRVRSWDCVFVLVASASHLQHSLKWKLPEHARLSLELDSSLADFHKHVRDDVPLAVSEVR